MSLLLEGKCAFISGGTRGIGAAMCEVFAREGADVAFNYNSRDDLAEEVKTKVEAFGRRCIPYKISVTDRVGMKKLVRELTEEWGFIDILVNNAAVNKPDNFVTTTDKSWDWVIDTNVNSLFAVTKPFYKKMVRNRKGSILEYYFNWCNEFASDVGSLCDIESRNDRFYKMSFTRSRTI